MSVNRQRKKRSGKVDEAPKRAVDEAEARGYARARADAMTWLHDEYMDPSTGIADAKGRAITTLARRLFEHLQGTETD